MRQFALTAILILLAGCGEIADQAYRRGYDHGATDVCNSIDRFSARMYDTLRREQIC